MSEVDDVERLAAELGQLLLRTHRHGLYGRLTATEPGVDAATYPVLSGLARLGAPTATELAEQIGIDRTVTTRYATRLQDAGLLTRRPHPADARAATLHLTEAGRRTVERLRRRLHDLLRDATAGWTPEQTHTFVDMFAQVVGGLFDPGSDA